MTERVTEVLVIFSIFKLRGISSRSTIHTSYRNKELKATRLCCPQPEEAVLVQFVPAGEGTALKADQELSLDPGTRIARESDDGSGIGIEASDLIHGFLLVHL